MARWRLFRLNGSGALDRAQIGRLALALPRPELQPMGTKRDRTAIPVARPVPNVEYRHVTDINAPSPIGSIGFYLVVRS